VRWALYNLTTTTRQGGVEMSVWALGRALAARGHEVTVYGGLSERPLPAGAEALTVLTFAYRPRESFPNWGSRFRKLMERISFARRALPELERRGCDRLMVFKSFDLAPALLAKKACKAKAGFLSGGSESYPGLAWLARRMDYLASVSAFNAGQIGRLVAAPPRSTTWAWMARSSGRRPRTPSWPPGRGSSPETRCWSARCAWWA
jgi:hypothetical protein